MVVPEPPQPPIHRRRRRSHRLPLVPAGPQDLGPRPTRRRLSILLLVIRGLRSLTRGSGWRAIGVSVLAAGAAYGCWAGVSAAYQHFSTRTIGVCVATDFSYREEKPDWRAALPSLFAEINRMFQGTGVKWKAWDGGEAYAPGTRGDMAWRAGILAEHSSCQADVILGLTAQPDAHANSVASPFSHTLLVEDSAANTRTISAALIARALARLFGVPGSAQALVLADAQGGIFDQAAVRIIGAMRRYDFARGISALPGRMEKRAVEVLADALAGKDPHPEAQANVIVGRAFGAALRYDDAVRHLGEAARLDPQNASMHFAYAMALQSASRSDEAITELRTAAALDPADAKPHALMGAIDLNRRHLDEAVDEFRAAAELDPHDASYQTALGQALSAEPGRIHEASAAFEAALRMKPAEPRAFAGLARENGVEQTLLQAVRQMEAQVNQKPSSGDAHLKLGLAQAVAGDAAAARSELQRALELEPGNSAAHLALARLNYLSGQYQAAKAELDRAKAAGAWPNSGFADAIQRKVGRTGEISH